MEGTLAAFVIFSQVTEYFPRLTIKIRKIYNNSLNKSKNIVSYTEDEILTLSIDTNMTKEIYHD